MLDIKTVFNHNLEDTKKTTHEKTRNFPVSKSSYVSIKSIPVEDHSKNPISFSESKHFICSTCLKCVFEENHDNWIEYLLTRMTQDYTNTPSPPLLCSSPSAPNAPSKTPSTQGTFTSSIPSSSSSINDYINTHLSPPPRTTISNKKLSSYTIKTTLH